ncbi:pentatricopeptide repeat-containing protein At3g24000, mitochondrial-like [Cryptomeria japonica]|uniref:pentatricopeptide repeat-containing protein At3g24000, mitochondrial-like n=1 Tax=Cryptomeria japonica TaxID=3369 RepID=UPI0027DA72CD|nr:pentatricopeptide repeat-containing protein At3g24000, mitochondrial-like [Cryptomeria japonica]
MERGFLSDIVVENCLIDMYIKCGRMDKARELFDKMTLRYAISWTAIIAGYKQNGCVGKDLEIFNQMQLAGYGHPSKHKGRGIFLSDVTVATALVDIYAKCGSIDKVCEFFDRMPKRDVVSWNAMIAEYAQHGFFDKAFETFKQVQLADIKPNSKIFAGILPAWAKTGALDQGMDIHNSIMEGGFWLDIMVGNAPVDMI